MLNVSKNYIDASKLIEAYTSFFEKLSYSSSECDRTLDKLTQLKRKLYQNIRSRPKTEEAFNSLFKDGLQINHEPQSFKPTIPSINSASKLDYLDPLPKSPLLAENPSFGAITPVSTLPILDNFQDLTPTSRSSWGHLDIAFQLANQIKLASHIDGHKISTFLNSFGLFRTFNQPHESAFYALCAGFFECHLVRKLSQYRPSLATFLISKLGTKDNDIETLCEYLDTQFLSIIKSVEGSTLSEEEAKVRFYESLLSNTSLYNSCVLTFKKIIAKLLEKRNLDVPSKKISFQWMNEGSELDRAFFEELAILFESDLYFYILTPTQLVEQIFDPINHLGYEESPGVNAQDFYILVDKSSNFSYILYQSKADFNKVASNLSPIAPVKKIKQRSYTPIIGRLPQARLDAEPGFTFDQFKKTPSVLLDGKKDEGFKLSPKSAGRIKKPVIITSPQNPLIQLGDLLRNASLPNTAGTYMHSNEFDMKSGDQGYNFSQKIEAAGLYDVNSSPSSSRVEYNTYSRNLMPKEKDMSPTRTNDQGYFQSPSSLADRIMEEINLKVKAEKGEKDYKSIGNIGSPLAKLQDSPDKREPLYNNTHHQRGFSGDDVLNRLSSPEKNYYEPRNLNSRTMSINQHISDLSKDLSGYSLGYEKPAALPYDLKSKVTNFNKIIDRHNFEFNQVIQSNIPKIADSFKNTQPASLAPYTSMIEKKEKKGGFMPSVGATMQMDT